MGGYSSNRCNGLSHTFSFVWTAEFLVRRWFLVCVSLLVAVCSHLCLTLVKWWWQQRTRKCFVIFLVCCPTLRLAIVHAHRSTVVSIYPILLSGDIYVNIPNWRKFIIWMTETSPVAKQGCSDSLRIKEHTVTDAHLSRDLTPSLSHLWNNSGEFSFVENSGHWPFSTCFK